MQKRVDTGEILITDSVSFIEVEAFRNVVIILWDKVNKACGICNFTSPSVYKSAMATAHFGNVAVPQLVKLFIQTRSLVHCEAYLFGGASMGENDIIGAQNLQMAKKVLASYTVPVVSESIGGKLQRHITFNSENGECVLIKTHHQRR